MKGVEILKIKWPKDFSELLLAVAFSASAIRMILYEQPTSFQWIIILLLILIFNRLNRKEVNNHTHHIEINRPTERK